MRPGLFGALIGASISILSLSPAIVGASMLDDQLISAAGTGDAKRVRTLVKEGASIEARDASGATALLVATHENRLDVARALIEAGADVNAKDKINDSPYLYAGARGHLEILKLTLANGADLKSTNRYGGTALIPAAERGHVETVKTLIDAGIDVDHVNRLGWTALLEAIILGTGGERHTDIVRLLVKAGADVNLADGEGVSPLAHARKRGYDEIVELLTDAGAHERELP
jgi:hypothetical protein